MPIFWTFRIECNTRHIHAIKKHISEALVVPICGKETLATTEVALVSHTCFLKLGAAKNHRRSILVFQYDFLVPPCMTELLVRLHYYFVAHTAHQLRRLRRKFSRVNSVLRFVLGGGGSVIISCYQQNIYISRTFFYKAMYFYDFCG